MLFFIFYLDYLLRDWETPPTISLQHNQRRGKQAITLFLLPSEDELHKIELCVVIDEL
jgi:hypothetical protein